MFLSTYLPPPPSAPPSPSLSPTLCGRQSIFTRRTSHSGFCVDNVAVAAPSSLRLVVTQQFIYVFFFFLNPLTSRIPSDIWTQGSLWRIRTSRESDLGVLPTGKWARRRLSRRPFRSISSLIDKLLKAFYWPLLWTSDGRLFHIFPLFTVKRVKPEVTNPRLPILSPFFDLAHFG